MLDKKQKINKIKQAKKVNNKPASIKKTGVVNYKSVYLRTNAGREFPPIAELPVVYKNDQVTILQTIKGSKGQMWYYVRVMKKNAFGFIMAKYVDVK